MRNFGLLAATELSLESNLFVLRDEACSSPKIAHPKLDEGLLSQF